jgi:hypothetical protein
MTGWLVLISGWMALELDVDSEGVLRFRKFIMVRFRNT